MPSGTIQKRPDVSAKANAVSSKLSACDNIEPLSGEWLNAGQAINELDNLDQLKADIARAKQKCMDQLNTGDGCPPENPDTDEDGVCDSDDPCPKDKPDDKDGDGVCTSDDPCPDDNPDDPDGDGVCTSDDPCPENNPDDKDGDGVCDSDDVCPGKNDKIDADGDGIPDCKKKPADDDFKCVGANKIRNPEGKCVCELGYPDDGKGNCVDPMDKPYEEHVKTVSEGQEERGEEIKEEPIRASEEEPIKRTHGRVNRNIEEALPPAVKPPKHEPEPNHLNSRNRQNRSRNHLNSRNRQNLSRNHRNRLNLIHLHDDRGR